MKNGIRIGSLFGIPVLLDPSWFLLIPLMTILTSLSYGQSITRDAALALTFGLLTALALCVSLLFHELAHTYVARSQGVPIESISLSVMGGFRTMEGEYKKPWSAFSVAVMGPLASILLGVLCLLLVSSLGSLNLSTPKAIQTAVETFGPVRVLFNLTLLEVGQLNLLWGIFNLLPALPLDGGQALRALVWKFTGDRRRGTVWAARSGQIMGYLLMGLGILGALRGAVGGFILVIIGWMTNANAVQALQQLDIQKALTEIQAESTMTRDFRLVDGDMSIRQFADNFLLMEDRQASGSAQPIYVVSTQGRDQGVVLAESLRTTERHDWERRKVSSLAMEFDKLATVKLNSTLVEIVQCLENQQTRYLLVMSPVGSVAGVIDRGDVLRALGNRMMWRFPESYLQQVKAGMQFPAEIPLKEMCNAIAPTATDKNLEVKD
ncbi:MAG: site-2 protease family protein [Pseudanabaenaceae cyanobacterium]|jgi:Zn-dependent protease